MPTPVADERPYETIFSKLKEDLAREEADDDFEDEARHDAAVATGGLLGLFFKVPFAVWTFVGLIGGMVIGSFVPALGFIGAGVKDVFGVIAALAPVIIFFTLTPALITMFRTSSAGKFALAVVVAFSITTAAGGIWALALTFAIFPDMGFGLGTSGLGTVLRDLGNNIGGLLFTSAPFKAIWGALLTSVLLYYGGGMKHASPTNAFRRMLWTIADIYELVGVYGVSALGKIIKIVMPAALFAIGIFLVVTLPETLADVTAAAADIPEPPFGAVQGYFITVGIVVGITVLWLGLAGFAVARYTGFPFGRMIKEYMLIVYPFSWSTSSSAASIPINLEAARRGLHVRSQIRDFVVPLGATVNLDGTMMSAVVTTVVAAKMVGFTPSILDLLVALIPLVVITVGTPGVPGGLALVAAPVLATILPLPPGTAELFTGIFIAFGFGLNDQFRTAVNTLDNGLLCLLFEKWWPTTFDPGAEPNPIFGSHGEPVIGPEALDDTPATEHGRPTSVVK